jgi:hypothetical protein
MQFSDAFENYSEVFARVYYVILVDLH